MPYVIIVVLLAGVVWLIGTPLWRVSGEAAQQTPAGDGAATRRIELIAARDAKYREIRDAELDHQTGKLSDEDYAAIDSTLRAEAVELLHLLDELDVADRAD